MKKNFKFLSTLALTAVLALNVVAGGFSVRALAACGEETNSIDFYSGYQLEVVGLVNEIRAENGLSPVALDGTLTAVAQERAEEATISLSHTRPNGSRCFTAFAEKGVTYKTAGENIAAGQATPSEVVDAWMASPTHRANILNPDFTEIGVGYVTSSDDYGSYWAQCFIG